MSIKLPYKLGRERLYNNNFQEFEGKVVMWEVLRIKQNQEIKLKFVSTNSKYRQGVRLAIDAGEGEIIVNGFKAQQLDLWEDTCPQVVTLKCSSSESVLSIYNIFDLGKERGGRHSQMDSCGMLVEQNENVYRYHCNDVGFQTNFDKLIFEIELL